MIERTLYKEKLIRKMNNGLVKVITGIRRCGKSYLLFNIFYDYLKNNGIEDDHIIRLALDDTDNIKYRNPLYLDEYLKSKITGDGKYFNRIQRTWRRNQGLSPFVQRVLLRIWRR